jgi:TPP-dependent pyruvate/acetoin dehydrogenase alpha subunit
MARCPIRALAKRLNARGIDSAKLDEITAQADREIEDAVKFARASEYPSTDTLLKHVYVDQREAGNA